MAIATNAFNTFDARGNREDLSDSIYRIDPTDTPFYSGIEREKATATLHEWQTQALAAPSAANAQQEGEDAAVTDAAVPTVRLSNVCQISIKIPRVTGTQEVVDHAGRGSEMDYQIMLKGKELKRDVETIMLSNTAKVPAAAAATVRKLASVLSWIKGNTNVATTGTLGVDPATADGLAIRTDGTQRAFTETMLKDVLQKCWTAGGEPDVIMLGGFNKQAFSTFTGRGTPTEDQASKTITAGVDVYRSDFGRLRAVPNRFMRTPSRDVLVLQMDMWASAALPGRNFISFELAKTGDSERRELLVEHTLVARNQLASGGVFDLLAS